MWKIKNLIKKFNKKIHQIKKTVYIYIMYIYIYNQNLIYFYLHLQTVCEFSNCIYKKKKKKHLE